MAHAANAANVPWLVYVYVRLARQQEREALAEFGDAYSRCAATAPVIFPRLGGISEGAT